ncbi:MAG: ferritin-like domain-containing protein [Bacilli bacterium]|nr:ferritin-like domain-containing protein [Bacilli bacterium]MDD4077319.1 ferritin-like domain-containing protein [Bacilli bacterium]MDD4387824.1 ferritin-like domain-containing protein [Bacilli bacterium]
MHNQEALTAIISGLNGDLSREYAAIIQYIQHAAMLSGPEYFAIIDEIEEHADEEKEHAIILSSIIQYLGGVPTIEVTPRYTSNNNREMLMQDLQAEYDAIQRYLERIRQLEALGLYDSAQKLRNIVAVEQEHAIDLEIALGLNQDGTTGSNWVPPQKTSY